AVHALAHGHVRWHERGRVPAIDRTDEHSCRDGERRGGGGEGVPATARGVLADGGGGQPAERGRTVRRAELEPARRVRGAGGYGFAAARTALPASEQRRDVHGDESQPEG